jgi:hypothetical protein
LATVFSSRFLGFSIGMPKGRRKYPFALFLCHFPQYASSLDGDVWPDNVGDRRILAGKLQAADFAYEMCGLPCQENWPHPLVRPLFAAGFWGYNNSWFPAESRPLCRQNLPPYRAIFARRLRNPEHQGEYRPCFPPGDSP